MVEVDFPEGDDVSLRYDGDGNRYKKVAGSTTTKFLFDTNLSLSALLLELDGNDTVQAKYRRDSFGLLLAMKRGDTLSMYHFDALGSTRALTNASETTTDTYEYDAWGNVTARCGTTANPFGFVGLLGYYDDPHVGLVLLGARFYIPAAGRFASVDPLSGADPYLLDPYAYAFDNPVTFVDPGGHLAWLPVIGIGIGVVVVITAFCGGVFAFLTWVEAQLYKGRHGRDLWQHCMWNCYMTHTCTRVFAWLASFAKELWDLVFGTGWSPDDWRANAVGRRCGKTCGVTHCDACCEANL